MKENNILKRGYTTGSYVAASAKAGITFFETGVLNDYCLIKMPHGETEKIKFKSVKHNKKWIEFSSIKDSGDDPDITNGMEIVVRVKKKNNAGIDIKGGKGVGIVTLPGLQVKVGEPAINPCPKKMIFDNVKELVKSGNGYSIEIIFPEGKELAKQTFNPRIGIVGGLSVLGTSGYVEPKSVDAIKKTICLMIDMTLSRGFKNIIFVPGNIGERLCKNYFKVTQERIVQTSNHIGYAVKCAAQKKVEKLLVCGHIGKLVKIAAGMQDTSSRIGDRRIKTIVGIVREMKLDDLAKTIEAQCKTAENAAELILNFKSHDVFDLMARMISANCEKWSDKMIICKSAVFNYEGKLLGTDLTDNQINWWQK
ncbi:MAG: cobalt-precorrin-5B (C(1))-methyltransferase CbiD [Actinomycetota bacterium]|nr:cobalt-precorrin-5B (C(1))-methyltransferase CbiD [Actinomycetota bacterium]